MKRTAAIILIAALFALTGCGRNFMPRGSEITTYDIVRAVGFDKCADNHDDVDCRARGSRA